MELGDVVEELDDVVGDEVDVVEDPGIDVVDDPLWHCVHKKAPPPHPVGQQLRALEQSTIP